MKVIRSSKSAIYLPDRKTIQWHFILILVMTVWQIWYLWPAWQVWVVTGVYCRRAVSPPPTHTAPTHKTAPSVSPRTRSVSSFRYCSELEPAEWPSVLLCSQPWLETVCDRGATKIFEDFGGALNNAFIRGWEPVSIVHYTRPGSSIKQPTPN